MAENQIVEPRPRYVKAWRGGGAGPRIGPGGGGGLAVVCIADIYISKVYLIFKPINPGTNTVPK